VPRAGASRRPAARSARARVAHRPQGSVDRDGAASRPPLIRHSAPVRSRQSARGLKGLPPTRTCYRLCDRCKLRPPSSCIFPARGRGARASRCCRDPAALAILLSQVRTTAPQRPGRARDYDRATASSGVSSRSYPSPALEPMILRPRGPWNAPRRSRPAPGRPLCRRSRRCRSYARAPRAGDSVSDPAAFRTFALVSICCAARIDRERLPRHAAAARRLGDRRIATRPSRRSLGCWPRTSRRRRARPCAGSAPVRRRLLAQENAQASGAPSRCSVFSVVITLGAVPIVAHTGRGPGDARGGGDAHRRLRQLAGFSRSPRVVARCL